MGGGYTNGGAKARGDKPFIIDCTHSLNEQKYTAWLTALLFQVKFSDVLKNKLFHPTEDFFILYLFELYVTGVIENEEGYFLAMAAGVVYFCAEKIRANEAVACVCSSLGTGLRDSAQKRQLTNASASAAAATRKVVAVTRAREMERVPYSW